MKKIFSIVIVSLVLFNSPLPADTPRYITEPIQRAKYLVRSGVAHDAFETMFGLIKIVDPRSFFSPSASQVTWWGEFKPFNSWSTPNLTARWINPDGRVVAVQNFKPQECRLAKVTLDVRERNIELKEGRWMTEVSMDGKPIDRKNFVVFDPRRPPATRSAAPTPQDVQIPPTPSGGDAS